jgi:PhoPQ-activated pathogenicity-related protein
MENVTHARVRFRLLGALAAAIVGVVLLAGSPPRYASLTELISSDAPVTPDRVTFERGATELVDSRFFPERRMRRIGLSFTSQVYRGLECRHRATVYLPGKEISPAAKGKAAIVLGGNVTDVPDITHDWIETVVVRLGVPCMVVDNGLPAKELGARNAGELMSMGDRTFRETGDAREAGYYAMARIYVAAATVAGQLPELRATQFITSGSSKGGMSALIACAGDPRIVGSYPTAFNAGDFLDATRLKGERWGWNVKPKPTGPAGEPAINVLRLMESPHGQYYRRLLEPATWDDLLADKFVMPAVGTNDHLFHLLSDRAYYDKLTARRALLRVPNYGHGRGAPEHAQAWRFAVAAALLDRTIPSVRIRVRESEDTVSILVALDNVRKIKRLTLYTARDGAGDYRKAKWEPRGAKLPADSAASFVAATLGKPSTGTLAVFAQLVEEGPLANAITSSNVVEVGDPVHHSLEP